MSQTYKILPVVCLVPVLTVRFVCLLVLSHIPFFTSDYEFDESRSPYVNGLRHKILHNNLRTGTSVEIDHYPRDHKTERSG